MSSSKDFDREREAAINDLKAQGILRSREVIRAMLTVRRENFLPTDARKYAYVDSPLAIGYGQTTSALHMTALFCELGELKSGQRVLEVGSGCGYMCCIYAEIVAPSNEPKEKWGHVWSVEIIEELAKFAQENVSRNGYAERVTVLLGDASVGHVSESPYDVIIVTAAAPRVPVDLTKQLAAGGTLLIPVGGIRFCQQLLRLRKDANGKISEEGLGSVAFVPMTGKEGWK